MVVALVQKCGREYRVLGHEPPTNLGYYLDEFFDFYGNQLNYASTGEPEGGKGYNLGGYIASPTYARKSSARHCCVQYEHNYCKPNPYPKPINQNHKSGRPRAI